MNAVTELNDILGIANASETCACETFGHASNVDGFHDAAELLVQMVSMVGPSLAARRPA